MYMYIYTHTYNVFNVGITRVEIWKDEEVDCRERICICMAHYRLNRFVVISSSIATCISTLFMYDYTYNYVYAY